MNEAAFSPLNPLEETLLQAQAHHAGGGAKIVDLNVQGRWGLFLEDPLEQVLPALLGAVDRGLHLDAQGARRARFQQHLKVAGADATHQRAAFGRLPGGEFKG